MRRRYIQMSDGEIVEVPLDYVAEPQAQGLLVIPDLKPYASVITGEEIGGRRQHREHLRRHGCIEVGNEKIGPAPMPKGTKAERVESIKRAMTEWKHGKRPQARFGHG